MLGHDVLNGVLTTVQTIIDLFVPELSPFSMRSKMYALYLAGIV